MDDATYFAQRTAESIGKRVRLIDPTIEREGVIVAGDFSTGQWDVRFDDGVTETHPGPDLQEITLTK